MSGARYVTGLRAVEQLLASRDAEVRRIFAEYRSANPRVEAIVASAQQHGIEVQSANRARLEQMSGEARHQGVVAEIRRSTLLDEAALRTLVEKRLEAAGPSPLLLLVLDSVQDPHNLGACLRSADAAGAHAVIVPREHSAPLSAVARRAASGAAESIPVFQVVNLARTLRQLKEAGVWLAGASQEAESDIFHADLHRPLAIVLGGEGKGLRRLTEEQCDMRVRIPMAGSVESLNVSVAAGVCLFEAVRQRQREK